MKNKKVIIVGIIGIIIVAIIATIIILDRQQANAAVISSNTSNQRQGIMMGMLMYDKNIKCDTKIKANKKEIWLVFTAQDSYTQSKYGKTVVKVKLDKNTYKVRKIDTDFSELKDSIQEVLSDN